MGGADEQEEMANDTNFGEGYILEQGDDEDFDDEEDSIVEDQLERQRKNRKLLYNNNVKKQKNAKWTMSASMSHGNNNSRTTARRQSRIGRGTNTETTTGSGGLMSKSPRIEGSTTNSTVQGGGGSVALFGRAISSFSIRNGGNKLWEFRASSSSLLHVPDIRQCRSNIIVETVWFDTSTCANNHATECYGDRFDVDFHISEFHFPVLS